MTKAQKESLIKKNMEILGVSYEEALEIVEFDEETDKMTMKQLNDELTPEQKEAKKQATKTGTRIVTSAKKPRERKADDEKAEIIAKIAEIFGENAEIVNKEREICLKIGKNDYSITLTKHRKAKN